MKTFMLINFSLLIFSNTLTFQADRISVDVKVKKLEGNVYVKVNETEINADLALIDEAKKEIIATSNEGNKVRLSLKGKQTLLSDSIRLNYEDNTFTASEISLIKN